MKGTKVQGSVQGTIQGHVQGTVHGTVQSPVRGHVQNFGGKGSKGDEDSEGTSTLGFRVPTCSNKKLD